MKTTKITRTIALASLALFTLTACPDMTEGGRQSRQGYEQGKQKASRALEKAQSDGKDFLRGWREGR